MLRYPGACTISAVLLLAPHCTSREGPRSDSAAGVDSGSDAAVIEAGTAGELTARARRVVDLTVLLAEMLPAHWGSNPPFARWTNNWFEQPTNAYGSPASGSSGPYYSQRFVLDEHTGTQTDFPAHFVPPPDSGLPHASPMGAITGDKYPLSRLMGPAVVIDVTDLRDAAEPGFSAPITVERIQAWESEHGSIQPGEVVLFHSGYSDAYYKPLPEGARMTMEPLVLKTAPGWPAPTPEAVKYLFDRGVWHLGTDGASMGPVEDGQPTHLAGLQQGMSWEELLINLGELPTRGAFYIALPLKVADQSGAPTRAIALLPEGGSQ
ncbi:MAG: cyclase family protein [Acidobacteriia bacterium]|nr:cyclase family protein [Terriglobia bacterium]MYG04723.1 cyclase family protein [Terriglobia bacterium]MYK11634.1 cyclase family protein [Terriglobia bacterium]